MSFRPPPPHTPLGLAFARAMLSMTNFFRVKVNCLVRIASSSSPWSFYFLVIPSIAIATGAGTPAPTARVATATCAAAAAASASAITWAPFTGGIGRRSHEGKVDVDGLVE